MKPKPSGNQAFLKKYKLDAHFLLSCGHPMAIPDDGYLPLICMECGKIWHRVQLVLSERKRVRGSGLWPMFAKEE